MINNLCSMTPLSLEIPTSSAPDAEIPDKSVQQDTYNSEFWCSLPDQVLSHALLLNILKDLEAQATRPGMLADVLRVLP